MPSGRLIAACLGLFITSALFTASIHHSHPIGSLPTLFRLAPNTPSHPASYSQVAFATFVATTQHERDNSTNLDNMLDGYYVSARVLAHRLLHAPSTRSNHSIPLLVLVTPDVAPVKRDRLARDGATVIVADTLRADWVVPGSDRWRDVLTKLRLFQLTQYKKICFIDADHLVTAPLDGVFDDPATDLLRTRHEPLAVRGDEPPLPPTYMFAGKADANGYGHEVPPPQPGSDYLNSGFYVFQPSKLLFDYYVGLLGLERRFDPSFPEQNLFNYAHRRDGNMPWASLSWRWNMNWPTMRDYDGGARSFHAKYWDGDGTHDPELERIWLGQRKEMEGYYAGVDDALASS